MKLGEIALQLQSNRVIYLLINVAWAVYQYLLRCTFLLFRVCNIQKNKIVFGNINGRGFSDHPKYILQELNKSGHQYDLVWLFAGDDKSSAELPENVRTVKPGSLKAAYELSTAKIWVDNAEKRLSVIKRKGQYFLETWHGFGPKNAVDNDSIAGWRVRTHLKHNAKMIDAYVSNNDLLTRIYHTDFFYPGEVLQVGFPRNDILVSKDKTTLKNKVFGKFVLPTDSHIILYAPTYRPNTDMSLYNLNYTEILTSLEKKFGGKWVFLLRLHPVIARLSAEVIKNNPNVIDASAYLDMQELLAVSEVLITDYSSCMFDFAVTKGICLLYHPDEREYENERGFCIQPTDLPFPRCQNTAGLIGLIENLDFEMYEKSVSSFFDNHNLKENGTASEKIVQWLTEKINS